MERKPDFFIVGAPKCGTTSLYRYLQAHPHIFMPGQDEMGGKEPHFFGRDLDFRTPGRPAETIERYSTFFAAADPAQRIGEASTWYLYSRTAAAEIKHFNPAAKIIIMLRNPIDAMYSLHSQRLYNGIEHVTDFAEALALEAARKRGEYLPARPGLVNAFFYRESVRYREQVQRYLKHFGRQRVLVLLFRDFVKETAVSYRQVLRFLDVDPTFTPSFAAANANKQVRARRVQRLLQQPPAALRATWRLLTPVGLRRRLAHGLHRLNTRHVKRPPLSPALRQQLQAELRPEREALSLLLERDLSHWQQTKRGSLP